MIVSSTTSPSLVPRCRTIQFFFNKRRRLRPFFIYFLFFYWVIVPVVIFRPRGHYVSSSASKFVNFHRIDIKIGYFLFYYRYYISKRECEIIFTAGRVPFGLQAFHGFSLFRGGQIWEGNAYTRPLLPTGGRGGVEIPFILFLY